MNSDGFDKKAYLKMVEETWKAYPNISYTTKINKIEFNDNYATVTRHHQIIAVMNHFRLEGC